MGSCAHKGLNSYALYSPIRELGFRTRLLVLGRSKRGSPSSPTEPASCGHYNLVTWWVSFGYPSITSQQVHHFERSTVQREAPRASSRVSSFPYGAFGTSSSFPSSTSCAPGLQLDGPELLKDRARNLRSGAIEGWGSVFEARFCSFFFFSFFFVEGSKRRPKGKPP